jgi:hypothetical protein
MRAMITNVARYLQFSTAVLHSTHGTAASQWICWVLARNIRGCQIFDSRGNPTVEVDVTLVDGSMGGAAVSASSWLRRDRVVQA